MNKHFKPFAKSTIAIFMLMAISSYSVSETLKPITGQVKTAKQHEISINHTKIVHPEITDPVLGDNSQIVEWSWSSQYAKRFGMNSQPVGLPDGGLWLIGIKLQRQQYGERQRYACSIVGLIDNKLPILTPPSDIYMIHPDYIWLGGLPGVKQEKALTVPKQGSFSPAIAVWAKSPNSNAKIKRPERGIAFPYTFYYKFFQTDLAYFEWNAGCGSFNNPELFRNEIRFPTHVDGANDSDKQNPAVFESSAIAFDIPEELMRRIYPLIIESEDWSSCFMKRAQGKSALLSMHAIKTKRFGKSCEPRQSN